MEYDYNNQEYLQHYGVPGMKWGIRRNSRLLANHNRNEKVRTAKLDYKTGKIDKKEKKTIISDANKAKKAEIKSGKREIRQTHGYKNIKLLTNLTYSGFDFISAKLNEVDVNYEYNLHKYGFTEADLKFSSFIQRLQQYPSAQKVIVHSANNSKNSMHMTLARGLANERIGGQLPPNYGPILAFLA